MQPERADMTTDTGRSPSGRAGRATHEAPTGLHHTATIPNASGEVFASFGSFGAVDVKRGIAKKVTPTGQIVADFGEVWGGSGERRLRRFGADGFEIGGEVYRRGHIITEDNYNMLAKKRAGIEAGNELMALLRSWSWRTKAELNALVAKLLELADRVPDDESTAIAIEARQRTDPEEGLDPKGESAGPQDIAQGPSQ